VGIVFHYQNIISRETYWRATVTALATHPIFGLGLGAWWTTVQTDIMPGGPHSTYLQLYSDCGVLGLIALLLMFVALIILGLKILRSRRGSLYFGLGIGLLAGIVVMAGDAFIDNTFVVLTPVGKGFICFTAPFIWVVLALFTIVANNLSGNKAVTHMVR
jgi:O-antigen ligase